MDHSQPRAAKPVSLGSSRIRVLIAEGVTLVRDALAVVLDLADDIDVVGQVARGDEIVSAAMACRPNVAVVGARLPGIDGIDAAVRLRTELSACRVLILDDLAQPWTLRRALSANVAGYLLKDASTSELTEAIRKVANRQQIFHPMKVLAIWDNRPNPLTPREAEVLQLAAEGADPQEIAVRLRLSIGTVRNYLAAVVAKLNARNRVDALRIARESGWLN